MATQAPPIGEPGFNLYANQGKRIRSANIVFIIIPTFFVILRLISRKISRAGYWVRQFESSDNERTMLMYYVDKVGRFTDRAGACMSIGDSMGDGQD